MDKSSRFRVFKAKDQENDLSTAKESPARSLAKAFTYRILAMFATFMISFVLFKRLTNKSLDEIIGNSLLIAILDFVAKIIIYYLHERLWVNIKWGKFWRKKYWKQRAWRKMYNKMHR